jgi:hypothetical protein
MYFNFKKLKCFPPHKEVYPQVFNKMNTSNQKQSSSQRQRRVNREHKKKNKNRAGFSHRDDERYSVEYNSSDHWGEIEESVPYDPGCYELDKSSPPDVMDVAAQSSSIMHIVLDGVVTGSISIIKKRITSNYITISSRISHPYTEIYGQVDHDDIHLVDNSIGWDNGPDCVGK